MGHHCTTDCRHHSHNANPEIKEEFEEARRGVLTDFAVGDADVSAGSLGITSNASAQSATAMAGKERGAKKNNPYYVPARDKNGQLGFFMRFFAPPIRSETGDTFD